MIASLLLPFVASISASGGAARAPFRVEEPERNDPGEEQHLSLLRRRRWGDDRQLRAFFGIGPYLDAVRSLEDSDQLAPIRVIASLGLRQRFAPDWDLQARASMAVLRIPAVDLDATFRYGYTRFYLGLGPLLRMEYAHEDRPLALGGGGVVEMGFLLGPERTIDLGGRVMAGITRDLDGEQRFFLLGGGGGSFAFPE